MEIHNRSGDMVYSSSLNISIGWVEEMFRQKNLTQEMNDIEQGIETRPDGVV